MSVGPPFSSIFLSSVIFTVCESFQSGDIWHILIGCWVLKSLSLISNLLRTLGLFFDRLAQFVTTKSCKNSKIHIWSGGHLTGWPDSYWTPLQSNSRQSSFQSLGVCDSSVHCCAVWKGRSEPWWGMSFKPPLLTQVGLRGSAPWSRSIHFEKQERF